MPIAQSTRSTVFDCAAGRLTGGSPQRRPRADAGRGCRAARPRRRMADTSFLPELRSFCPGIDPITGYLRRAWTGIVVPVRYVGSRRIIHSQRINMMMWSLPPGALLARRSPRLLQDRSVESQRKCRKDCLRMRSSHLLAPLAGSPCPDPKSHRSSHAVRPPSLTGLLDRWRCRRNPLPRDSGGSIGSGPERSATLTTTGRERRNAGGPDRGGPCAGGCAGGGP